MENIKCEYKVINNWEKKKKGLNEEYDLQVGFDIKFNSDRYNLSISSRVGWMVIDILNKVKWCFKDIILLYIILYSGVNGHSDTSSNPGWGW